MSKRHVKLFKNGRNQAVRIPREFELHGEAAIIRKEGRRLIIEAAPPRSLLAVLATLQTLDENFPLIEVLPAEPVPPSFDTPRRNPKLPRDLHEVDQRTSGRSTSSACAQPARTKG